MLFKLLALLVLIWIFFKALGQIFRAVFGITDTNRHSRYNTQQKRKADGIHVDYDPNQKDSKGYKGGEYIDYEEVE